MAGRAAEYWESAMDAETYLNQMTQRREQFERRIAATELSDARTGGVLRTTPSFPGA